MRRPRPRLALRLAACAAAGAAITTLLAWGFAAWGPHGNGWHYVENRPWAAAVPSGWPQSEKTAVGGQRGRRLVLQRAGCFDFSDKWSLTLVDCGFPLEALRSRVTCESIATRERWRIEYRLGLRNPLLPPPAPPKKRPWWEFADKPQRVHAWPNERPLPITPVWPGFAADTALYGTLMLALWSAPGFIRRRIRKSRGRCPACGYDRRATPAGGGPCPECGT